MAEIAAKYPQYGFDKHVGYGTALHLANLRLHGVTVLHRRSFKPVGALLA
jgi:ribonuclease HII